MNLDILSHHLIKHVENTPELAGCGCALSRKDKKVIFTVTDGLFEGQSHYRIVNDYMRADEQGSDLRLTFGTHEYTRFDPQSDEDANDIAWNMVKTAIGELRENPTPVKVQTRPVKLTLCP